MMMDHFAILIGAVFFVVACWLASILHRRKLEARRRNRVPEVGSQVNLKPIRIQAAAIASDLVPLVDKLTYTDMKIRIVGYDGSYLDSGNASQFRNALGRWAGKGATVEYFVQRLTPKARSELITLGKEAASSKRGCFRVHELNFENVDASDATRVDAISKALKTLHPTLIEYGGDKRAMWVEYDHPVGSSYAYDVKFVRSSEMVGLELMEFEHFAKQIKEFQDLSHLVVDSSLNQELSAA